MNYRNSIAFLLMFAIPTIIAAQEQLKHEKKVYVSTDNKTYINKELPVYFRIATSSDPKSDSYLLESERTKQYANPMYFDTEGRNTLRSPSAVDKVTKKRISPQQDILFEIYADGIAPATKHIFKSGKSILRNNKTYFSKDVAVDFTSSDQTSGIESILVSINREPFAPYNQKPFTFEKEQDYTIIYYAVDYVGNVENVKTTQFAIDITPPVTNYSILGEQKGKVLSSKASIKLTASDTLSGVDKIYYSVNDGKETIYASPIPLSVLSKENSKISFYAVDKLGNKAESKTISTFTGMTSENIESSGFGYYIDKEPPVISLEIEGDKYQGNNLYISPRSKIKINASDDKSGVEKTKYSLDNMMLNQDYSEPFTYNKEGKHFIAFSSTDYVGNIAISKAQQFVIDATAPVSKISISGPVFQNRDTTFINSKTTISVQIAENGSGLANASVYADAKETEYKTPFNLQNSGYQVVKYKGIDRVNNAEEWKEKAFYIDNEAPAIHYDFSVKAIGEKQVRDEKYIIYPSNVMLYISATDNASGGEKIEYKINGKPVPLSVIPIKGLLPGNYEIEVTAWDVLKNSTKETIKFSIEN